MAYLSGTDEEDQQQQGQSQGFDAFGGDGATGGPSSQGNGGQPGGGQSLGAWIGGGSSGGQASSSAPPSADAQAQQNASGYQSTYAGDDNQDAKSDAAAGAAPAASFGQPGAQSGLSGSGQGTGYINFQNYENNAPSEAGAITSAGQQVIGGEGTNLTNAEQPAQETLGQVAKLATPGSDQGSVDATVSGLLTDSAGGNNGYATQPGLQTLNAWMNPIGIDTTVNYTPSSTYTAAAPELTQTPVEGGQTTPSVVDYLAQNQIAQGGYTQGDRGLDQALISGDPGAQAAITGNQAMNTALQNRITTEVPALQSQLGAAQTTLTNNAVLTNQAVTDAGTQLQANITAATAAANANPTPQTIADENAAISAYQSWYNGAGQQGGVWTQTGAAQGQTAQAPLTSEQATEADNIYLLQHPGDTAHEPYPNPNSTGNLPQAATWGGSGSAGAPAITSSTQTDPGETANPSTGGPPLSTAAKYGQVIADPDKGSYVYPDLTPAENAVQVAMHPGDPGNYPVPSQADYAAAAYQLQSIINGGAGMNPAALGPYKQALAAVQAKMAGNTPAQTPYAYGKSLGMTDAQLAGMGIMPPGSTTQAPQNHPTMQTPARPVQNAPPSWK